MPRELRHAAARGRGQALTRRIKAEKLAAASRRPRDSRPSRTAAGAGCVVGVCGLFHAASFLPPARGAGRLGAGARVPAGQGPALPYRRALPAPRGPCSAPARARPGRAAFIGPAARLARRRRGARAQAGDYYETGRLRPAGLPRARALRPLVRRGARRRLRRLSQFQIKAHIRQRRLAAHARRGRLPRIGVETVPGLRPGRVGRVPAVEAVDMATFAFA